MADEFKQFDKEPIIPVVRISRWTFGLREVILAIIAGILLIMCLILAGLFGTTNEKLANVPTASAIVGQRYCTDLGCLRTAAHAVSFMNKSVNPCENFYKFACGNYKKTRPIFPNQGGRNVIRDLKEENEDRIIDVLEQPISAMHDYAAERKLKKFFSSCNDMYIREKLKGLPVLTKVLPALGGWKVLGTWDDGAWDLNVALKKTQGDFWVDALYGPRVEMENESEVKRIITLRAAGTGRWLNSWWYLHPGSYFAKLIEDYKKFIRRVGSLLVRDAATLMDPPQGNANMTEELLNEFVNDTYTMEYQIAHLNRFGRRVGYWAGDVDEQISLSQLTLDTGNVIDWAAQLSYLFNQAGVTGSTMVGIIHKEYFTGLSTFLQSLPEPDMKRILHNYLIWRVVESYVQELSWEYVHANREVYVDLHGRADFLGNYKYCFHLSEFYMGDALNHLYITQFLSKENKDMAHEISDNIRLALKTQLAKTPWMDEMTRKYALEKVEGISLKIGYPDWMANQGEIDDMYSSLVVNGSDFYGNLLRMNQFRRMLWNTELQRRDTLHEEWTRAVYETTAFYNMHWNELAAPAGILQFPIYDAHQPHFASFGSLGSIIGIYVHRFVDEWGKTIDKNGQLIDTEEGVGTWWSNSTETKYKDVKQCVRNAYSNLTRTIRTPDGHWRNIKVNASLLADHAIAHTNGIKLAILGYYDWAAKKGLNERVLPGLDMTYDQMLFLAHAQTVCEVEDRYDAYKGAMLNRMDAELEVNMAMGQMEEFSLAFQCQKDAKMNHAKKCQYY